MDIALLSRTYLGSVVVRTSSGGAYVGREEVRDTRRATWGLFIQLGSKAIILV